MDRNEQVRALLVGDSGTGFEGNESVVAAGVDHFGSQARG